MDFGFLWVGEYNGFKILTGMVDGFGYFVGRGTQSPKSPKSKSKSPKVKVKVKVTPKSKPPGSLSLAV